MTMPIAVAVPASVRWRRDGPDRALTDDRTDVAERRVTAIGGGGSLEDLMARTAGGDRSAFAALYDQVAPRIYALVLRVVRDPSQAEEVAQEVLLEVWRHASRFDADRGGALAWIGTMAHRRAVDRVRSEQSSRDRTEKVGRAETAPAFDDVAETVTDELERHRVRSALDALGGLQREAIELAYYGGLTYREVAERLDVPLGTIKTRMRDGLLRMREHLGAGT